MSERIINILKQISELSEQDENRQKLFAELCQEMNSMTSLDLSGNGISATGAEVIAEALKTNKTLTSLNFRNNNIRDAGAKKIAEALKTNKILTSLDLSGNGISAKGVEKIAEALIINKTLTSLNLESNNIVATGAEKIANALKANKTLTSLNLEYNNNFDTGAKEVAEALKANKTLISLDIIRDTGAYLLLEALKENKNITEIYLYGNQIEDELKEKIYNVLAKNKEEVKEFAEKLKNIFNSDQNQTTKYLSSSLLKDLSPRISAVSEILKKENEETYNSLKQFLSKKLKEFDMVAKNEILNKYINLNDDVKREIYKSLGIDVFGDDFELKRITPEVLKIAIIMQMQSEVNLYSRFLEERKYPTKNKKPDWQSMDIEVLKPAIEIFLDPEKKPTEKFPDLQSRIDFVKGKEIEKHSKYKEGLQKIIEDLQSKQTAKTPLDESEEVKKLKEQLVKSELARKEAEEKVKILEEELKKLKEEKKDKDRKGKSKLEESDSEDLSKPSTSVSGDKTFSNKAKRKSR